MATNEGIAAFRAAIEAIKEEARATMADAVERGADRLVSTAQLTCPVNDLEKHPGELRNSIKKIPGSHELMRRVTVDAQDEKGHYFAAHVEFGHMTKGRHVAAHPFFYPAWRLVRSRVKGQIQRGIKAAVEKQRAAPAPVNE